MEADIIKLLEDVEKCIKKSDFYKGVKKCRK